MKKTLTYFIATIAFVVLGMTAMAQGGSNPFLNSTHTYRVTMEDGTNLAAWVIADDAGTPLASQPSFTATVDADTAFMELTWSDSWAVVGDYMVVFSETDNSGTNCSAVKQLPVTVKANTFDVTTTTPAEVCNAADGQPNYAGANATTDVTFVVTMNTQDATFSPDWRFAFTLSSVSGATISDVAVGGTAVAGSGSYTSPDLASASGTASVNVTLKLTGGIYDAQDVTLSITSATELSYNSSNSTTNNKAATQVVNAIPNTSSITTD